MALPLVKVGILVGAGVLGSYLAQEGRVSDVVSGAFKLAWKQIRDDKSKTPSVKKPSNDALMAQMNKIRQELHSYSSSGPITIVTGSQTGASRYVILVVVVVAGYGYFWWKGWRLPDMMFATRRSLGDAGKSFSKQIDGVFSSISVTKRQLSSNLDGVDRNLAESIETTATTQTEVVELRGKTESICTVFKKVQDEVLTLETKINRLDSNQDPINGGVFKLCDFAHKLQKSRTTERIQASSSNSSRQCLELPPASPSSMVTPPKSSRSAPELPPASPSKENNGISEMFGTPALGTSNGASSSGRFGFKYPTSSTSTILRTRSATVGMLQQNQNRSTSRQL